MRVPLLVLIFSPVSLSSILFARSRYFSRKNYELPYRIQSTIPMKKRMARQITATFQDSIPRAFGFCRAADVHT